MVGDDGESASILIIFLHQREVHSGQRAKVVKASASLLQARYRTAHERFCPFCPRLHTQRPLGKIVRASRTMAQSKDNIHAAVKVDDRKEVKRILEQRKDSVNKKDATDQTPLHVAAMEGHIDTMCLLLKKNAHVNSQDKNSWTPLHCAAFSNHLQAMEILLDQGADVNIKNNEGSAAIHYLVRLKVNKEDKSLFNAVLEKFVEKKVDLNLQNVHGYSPLHQACFRQRKWNAKRLLFYKANINIKTK